MADSFRWACAASGLQIKWLALWILLVSPLLVIIAWVVGISVLGAIGAMLALALVVDVGGRLLGLATPCVRRWPVMLSATAQLSGLAIAATFVIVLAEGKYETAIGISLASLSLVTGQVIAAYLYTTYLADVATQLGMLQWADRSNQLRVKISQSISATSGMMSVALMLGMLTVIGGIITCGIGFFVMLPFDVLVLLGFMPMWVPIVWQMYGEYGRILSQLHEGIRNRPV